MSQLVSGHRNGFDIRWNERQRRTAGWVMDVLFKMEIQAFDCSWRACPWNWLGDSNYQTLVFAAVLTVPQMPGFLELGFGHFWHECCLCFCQNFANGSAPKRYKLLALLKMSLLLQIAQKNKTKSLSLKQYVRCHHSPFSWELYVYLPREEQKPQEAPNHRRSNLWSVESPETLGRWLLLKVSWRVRLR